MNVYSIPIPRDPLVDGSGYITREWFRFLQSIFVSAGSGTSHYTLQDFGTVDGQTLGLVSDLQSRVDDLTARIPSIPEETSAVPGAPVPEDPRSYIDALSAQLSCLRQAIDDAQAALDAVNAVPRIEIGTMAAQSYDRVKITGGIATLSSLTVSADNSLALTNQTNDSGGATATLTNAPNSGNPTFWLRIEINGSNYSLPAWNA